MSSEQCEVLEKGKMRNFRCSCDKAYLSYAALFTHIKLKHGGSAPGPISKPKNQKTKRGRPPMNMNIREQSYDEQQIRVQICRNPQMIELQELNEQYYESERNEMKIYEEISQYKYLVNLLEEPVDNVITRSRHPSIKKCYSQFFCEIRLAVDKQVYDELIILFALLTEYIADQYNDTQVLINGYIDNIIHKINEFIIDGLQWLKIRANLERLWVFSANHTLRILQIFFRWAQNRGYSDYKVKLKPSFG